MLGLIEIDFSHDGRDIFGQPETVVSANIYRSGMALSAGTITGALITSLEVDLSVGFHDLTVRLIDDQGTEGAESNPISLEIVDGGPSAATITGARWVPKT